MTSFQHFVKRTPIRWFREPQFLSRLAFISVLLVANLYLASRAPLVSRWYLLLFNPVMMVIIGAIASVIFLAYPRLGLLVLVPSFLLIVVDMSAGSGTQIGLPVLLLILLIGLWIFEMIARQRAIRLFPSATLAPMFAFLSVSLVSLGFGQLPWFDFAKQAPFRAQIGEIGIFVLSFLTYLWVGHTLPDFNTLKIAMLLFFIGAVVLMLGEYSDAIMRLSNYLVNDAVRRGSLFWVWLMALTFSQIVLNRKLRLVWRLALIGILSSALFISFIKYEAWTSGWLPGLVSILVILWLGVPKIRKIAILTSIPVLLFLSQKLYTALMVGDNQYSLSTRLAAWQIIAQIVPANPLFGLGPANYYWYTPLFSILGYRVVFNSHNNYVDLIAQLGIVGMVCFIWFALAVLRTGFRLRTVVQDGFERAFVYGVIGGWVGTLVAMMFGDWLLPFVYNVGYWGMRASLICWFFLGGLLFLERKYLGNGTTVPVEQEP